MNDFEVALPDGRSIMVRAPDENAAAAAARNFLMREPRLKAAEARGKERSSDNLAGSVSQGALFGFGDELAAGVRAALPDFSNWMMRGPALQRDPSIGGSPEPQTVPTEGTFGERYDQNLEELRTRQKAFAAEHPTLDIGGRTVGALATLPFMPQALLGGGIVRSAATGAGMGGVAGFGEGEGGLENRLISAGKGAALGGALGGGLAAGAAGARTLGNLVAESGPGRYVTEKVFRPGFNVVADALDRVAPKVNPGSLSAAAPEGGQVPADSLLGNLAQTVRQAAPSADDTLRDAAVRRITDALQRGGMTPEQARARLAELGVSAMPADLNPMATRLARTAYISPGGAPSVIDDAMIARNRATGDRIVADVDRAMPNSGSAVVQADRMRAARSLQGAGDYADAVGPGVKLTVSADMQRLMREAPAISAAVDRIQADAANFGVKLTPAQIAHRVKRQLAADADAAYGGRGLAPNKDDVGSLANQWRAALHDANPAIREADTAWQARSSAIDSLDLGRQFMRQGTGEVADAVSPAVLAERIPRMSAEEAQAFIAGAADTLKGQALSGLSPARRVAAALDENQNVRSKLVSMLGEDNARVLFNRAMSERRFAATDKAIRGGSDTAGKLLSVMDDAASGQIPTTAGSVVNRLLGKLVDTYRQGRAGNEAVRERIARMLTETDAVAHADLLDSIAAQLARQQAPRTVQRSIARAATAQE